MWFLRPLLALTLDTGGRAVSNRNTCFGLALAALPPPPPGGDGEAALTPQESLPSLTPGSTQESGPGSESERKLYMSMLSPCKLLS